MNSEVEQLEHEFWVTGGGNPDFWRTHCADDAIIALAAGVMGKDETVAAMETSRGWERAQFSDKRSVDAGDSIIMTYRVTAEPVGADEDYAAVVSSGYARRDGRWMLVFHQQTPQV
ncbi:MAG TPA: DUF4440 domain-containing protein [Acidimicrobiia bacterium]|nr:DUF4440 domain-containing protein [Acidimicrobiia bacterium]